MKLNQQQIKELSDPYYTLRLDGFIRFGTHRGEKVANVIDSDLDYMVWYLEHYIHPIDKKVIKYIKEKLAEQTNKQ